MSQNRGANRSRIHITRHDGVANKSKRRAVNTNVIGVLTRLLNRINISLRVHVSLELSQVGHARLLSQSHQRLLSVGGVIAILRTGISRLLKLPELTLGCRRQTSLGCQRGSGANLRQIMPLDTQSTVIDQILQLRLYLLSELRAVRAGKIGEQHHGHLRVRAPQSTRVVALAAGGISDHLLGGLLGGFA